MNTLMGRSAQQHQAPAATTSHDRHCPRRAREPVSPRPTEPIMLNYMALDLSPRWHTQQLRRRRPKGIGNARPPSW